MAEIHKDEPVLVGATATAAVGALMSVLVTHGVITDVQASADTQTVLPLVTAGVALLAGAIIRHFTASWSKVKHVVENGLHLTDADFGRLEALLESYGGLSTLLPLQTTETTETATVDVPAEAASPTTPAAVPDTDAGGGMSAGSS
jgi:hypothetical protein